MAKISARGAKEIKRHSNSRYLMVLRRVDFKNGKSRLDVLLRVKPSGSYSVQFTCEDEKVAGVWFDRHAETLDMLAGREECGGN